MTEQTRRECIKALARGFSAEKTAEIFGVGVDDVKSITAEEIDKGKENLSKWRKG